MRYLMGHLKGAVSVPFKKLQGPDGRLGPPEQLAAAFGEAGLGDEVTPVLYDHQDGRNAAMAAWALEYLGRDDVHVMDLRYETWKEQGREALYRPVTAQPKTFTPRPNPAVRAVLAEVAEISASTAGSQIKVGPSQVSSSQAGSSQTGPTQAGRTNPGAAKLLDTRSVEEYRGEAEADHRPGRIPGAINLPHTELAGSEGKLLIEPALLGRRLAACGIYAGDPVVAYCRSGVRASLAYLAMKQAGYNVRLYEGSYNEWMDSGRPVEP